MESRNYNPEAPRTRYKQLNWTIADTLSLLTVILTSGTVIVLSFIL